MWTCSCCRSFGTFLGFFPSREVNVKNKHLKLEFLWEAFYALDGEFPFEDLEKMKVSRINDLLVTKRTIDKNNSTSKKEREFAKDMLKGRPKFGVF